ncbi:MAG: glycoside hydrolase family 2 TIM barrel-domain containing protein [Verrucomicrobiota bacterium]
MSSVSGIGIALSNTVAEGVAAVAGSPGPDAARSVPMPPGILAPSRPLHEVELSGVWDFRPEGGSWRSIRVPGGGWLKQGFDCESALYQRRIRVPHGPAGQVVRLELGAVNHVTDCFLGGDEASLKKIGSDVTAFTPQVFDLTPHVRPGGDFLLRLAIRAYQNGRPVAPHWAEWCECIARGLFRSAHLRTYPDVFISDTQVVTSVAQRALCCQVWITNDSDRVRTVDLAASFSSWNRASWKYPSLPAPTLPIPARTTIRTTLGPVAWEADPRSYWWPNVPYRPDYRAQLHFLNLALREGRKPLCSANTRFGFRESRQAGPQYELNGVRVNFRGDNLQVANYDRVNFGGKSDAIDTLPGFLPPSAKNPGWPAAVDNFLRLNYNVQRQHMGPWTPYMIDVCDELGLMLIGESATRWDGFDMENGRGFHEVKCLQDLVRRDKNHPSIIRWSAKNEAQCTDPAYHLELYDAIKAIDPTRPISEDICYGDPNAFDVKKVFKHLWDKPDFTWIDHYFTYDNQGRPTFQTIQHNDAVIPMKERPYGLGEADWVRSTTPAGLSWFATTIALARLQGASDVRPYVLLSSWVSSIPGVKTSDFVTEENRHPVYGEDNLPDPWSHPGIRLLQTACHPLLAADGEFWKANRKCDAFGHFPVIAPVLPAKSRASRAITVFNDEFAGENLELAWELREGSPSNWVWDHGSTHLVIRPGFSQTTDLTFRTPKFNTIVFLNLKVTKGGVLRFTNTNTCYEITGGEDFRSEFNGEERQFK